MESLVAAQPRATGERFRNHRLALAVLVCLFFAWGFITCLNDILIPHLKQQFTLSYTQAMLIQLCFFGAYFVCSVPAGRLVNRIGYKKGIVVGLMVTATGALGFLPASFFAQYSLFLAALFVLASGITLLQVAANPYVVALGPAETAATRLNLTQAFNSLGTTVAPVFGGMLILGVATNSPVEQQAEAVQLPYLGIALFLLVLAVVIGLTRLPAIAQHNRESTPLNLESLKHYPHLYFGVIGIFVYVGAEVAIGSFLVNFLGESHLGDMSEERAASYVSYYWGGAMVGRFVGSFVMLHIAAHRVLAVNALVAAILVLVATLSSGSLAVFSILLVGLFNSIMFPTIFSLALRNMGNYTSQASGLLCLAIVGGAIIPLIQGFLADSVSLQFAFIVPAICYLYILWYGWFGSQKS